MHRTLATAIIAASFIVASPAMAQDIRLSEPLSNAANIPHSGVATYRGTYELSGVWTGITGDVQVVVDFGTGAVSADLTIPVLVAPGGLPSPAVHYTPTGTISGHGRNTGYTLTQGMLNSPTEPFISLSGSFSGFRALNTMGSFVGTICVPEPACDPGVNVFRNFAGTFAATRASPPS
jgi:hypothetical protein